MFPYQIGSCGISVYIDPVSEALFAFDFVYSASAHQFFKPPRCFSYIVDALFVVGTHVKVHDEGAACIFIRAHVFYQLVNVDGAISVGWHKVSITGSGEVVIFGEERKVDLISSVEKLRISVVASK